MRTRDDVRSHQAVTHTLAGVGTGTVVMLEGADMMRFLDDIKSDVDAIEDFPEQTEAPVIEVSGLMEDAALVEIEATAVK